MSVSRETVRDAMAVLLEAELVGAGNPVQAVYGYQIGDFVGLSPVVIVSSAGTGRQRMTFEGSRATFYLNVYIFVLYTDEDAWNEDDAEDRLDSIEEKIAGVLDANQRTADWEALDYVDRSVCDGIEIGGVEYRREVIPIKVEVYA